MKTLLLIATRDFHSSAGQHHAGQTVASIETDMNSGEIAALLVNTDRVAIDVEGDDEPDDNDAEPGATPADDNTPDGDLDTGAEPAAGDDGEGEPEPAAGNDPDDEGDPTGVDNRELSDLIESRPLKLFAALDPPVTTVAELAAWIDAGNLPRQINGIAETTEAEVLEATGLALPA